MLRPRFSRREFVLAIACGVALPISILYRYWLLPEVREWRDLRGEVVSLALDYQNMEVALELRSSVQETYDKEKARILASGSDTQELGDLFREIESLSRIAGVRIASMSPRGEGTYEFYKKYSVDVTVEGSVISVSRFLHAIETSQKLLKVERLKLDALSGNRLKAMLLITRTLATPEEDDVTEG